MLVFGDNIRSTTAGEKLQAVLAALVRAGDAGSGVVAHSSLVGAFIELSELAQGLADAEFEASGADANSCAEQEVVSALMQLAAIILRSWQSGFARQLCAPSTLSNTHALASSLDVDRTIQCKSGEGYAFYALYPESYLEAAKFLPRDTRFIGIRSIGLGLASLAAAAAGAPPPVSVRPFGHPFRREITVSPGLASSLLGPAPRSSVPTHPPEVPARPCRDGLEGSFGSRRNHRPVCFEAPLGGAPQQEEGGGAPLGGLGSRAGPYAIVDEGPGLSGSSFGAVADFLEDRGVSADRIHFLPGHAGDLGPHSSSRHRKRWRSAARHVVDFELLVLRASDPRYRLPAWIEDITGRATAPMEDISGGLWRAKKFQERSWPPAHLQQERRKFLLSTESGDWLVKFAGLGRIGEAKYARAKALCQAGFAPPVLGFRHGFLVEQWLDAKPVAAGELDRDGLIRHLAGYLTFRARHFRADRQSGAPLARLAEMARVNSAEALGGAVESYFARWSKRMPELERANSPIAIDGRLHWWEWLRLDDGRLTKTDAIDHHCSHDLVGCQDVAWDFVGAAVEFELSEAGTAGACRPDDLEHAEPIHSELIAFLMPCYLAFQAGYWTMADLSLRHTGEAQRLGERAAFYVEALRRLIAAAP